MADGGGALLQYQQKIKTSTRNLNDYWFICSHQPFWYSRVFHFHCLSFCRKANEAWSFCCRGGLEWTENHKKQRNCWGSHWEGTLHVWRYSVSWVLILANIQQVADHLSMAGLVFVLWFVCQWCDSMSFVCTFDGRRLFPEISMLCTSLLYNQSYFYKGIWGMMAMWM